MAVEVNLSRTPLVTRTLRHQGSRPSTVLTIPPEFLDIADLSPGDDVQFVATGDGEIMISQPITRTLRTQGTRSAILTIPPEILELANCQAEDDMEFVLGEGDSIVLSRVED